MVKDKSSEDNWQVMGEKLDKLEKTMEKVQDELKKLSDYLHTQHSDYRVLKEEVKNIDGKVDRVEKETDQRISKLENNEQQNTAYINKQKGKFAVIGTLIGACLGGLASYIVIVLK